MNTVLPRYLTPTIGVAATCALLLAASPLHADDADLIDQLDAADHDRRVLQLPGSESVVVTWTEVDDRTGDAVPHYAISTDGESFQRTGATSYELRLRYADFDPVVDGEPAMPEFLNATSEGFGVGGDGDGDGDGEGNGGDGPDDEANEIHIVQFVTQPLAEYRDAIEAHGGTIHKYLANHAYIVRIDEATRDAVADLDFVRWVGPYHPAYRLDETIFDGLTDDPSSMDAARYRVQVFERGPAQKDVVADFVEAIGGTVELNIPDGFIIEAMLTGDQIAALAHRNEVMWIDRWSEPEPDLNIAREIGGANYIEDVAGYSGQGVRGEVMDGNINLNHVEFQETPPLVHTPLSGWTDHGTATYGIVFSPGVNSSLARGLLPDAQGIFASYSNFSNRYAHTAELLEDPYNAVFQTNSWGNQTTTQYNTYSMEMDDILFDHDIVILQSQSNTGNQFSRPQAWAKNIISVGGVRHFNTLTKSDDAWNGSASIGPAADGRIKPDLTHFYDNVYTTDGDGGYRTDFGGTSAATPLTAGHVGLFYQMWADGIFGNEVDSGATVFENRPSAALARAMMINTAEQYPFFGTGHDLTRTHQGWGMADVGNLYDWREEIFYVNEDDLLTNLESTTYELEPVDGAEALRATLVHADPAGTTSSSEHLINDLTLKVVSPSGTTYYGNVGLLSGMWSQSGGQPGGTDPIENVFIEDPEPGVWEVTVTASEINENGVPGAPEFGSVYALVVSGVDLTEEPDCPADLTGDGVVGGADLGTLLGEWGPCPDPDDCPADLTGDGAVGGADLGTLLGEWGACE